MAVDKDTLRMTMLFDFYGDLLTEKQREYFDLYHNEDQSLSEVAENAGISKQGVHDIIKRAEKTLVRIEQKTKIIEKWQNNKVELIKAEAYANQLLSNLHGKEAIDTVNKLIAIIKVLQ